MQYAITPDLPSWSMCLGMPGIYVEVAREVAAHALALMRLGSPTSVTVEGSGLQVQERPAAISSRGYENRPGSGRRRRTVWLPSTLMAGALRCFVASTPAA